MTTDTIDVDLLTKQLSNTKLAILKEEDVANYKRLAEENQRLAKENKRLRNDVEESKTLAAELQIYITKGLPNNPKVIELTKEIENLKKENAKLKRSQKTREEKLPAAKKGKKKHSNPPWITNAKNFIDDLKEKNVVKLIDFEATLRRHFVLIYLQKSRVTFQHLLFEIIQIKEQFEKEKLVWPIENDEEFVRVHLFEILKRM